MISCYTYATCPMWPYAGRFFSVSRFLIPVRYSQFLPRNTFCGEFVTYEDSDQNCYYVYFLRNKWVVTLISRKNGAPQYVSLIEESPRD